MLADAEHWSDWNDGVSAIALHGPFEAGTAAEMTFPDGTELPFRLTWVEPGAGYEDLTEVPGDGPDESVWVRVRHALAPADDGGTLITYRCEAEATETVPAATVADIGEGASADFDAVIAALAARAESSAEAVRASGRVG